MIDYLKSLTQPIVRILSIHTLWSFSTELTWDRRCLWKKEHSWLFFICENMDSHSRVWQYELFLLFFVFCEDEKIIYICIRGKAQNMWEIKQLVWFRSYNYDLIKMNSKNKLFDFDHYLNNVIRIRQLYDLTYKCDFSKNLFSHDSNHPLLWFIIK